jgi:hypothetical protein
MAGIYTPVITNYPDNVVTVTSSGGVTYKQIINSMGSFIYGISKMYINANQSSQLLEPFSFTQYDVNGVIEQYSQINTVDPYQFQNSSSFDLSKKNVLLNGRNNLNLAVLPNEKISLIFYTNEVSNRDLVNPTNFFKDDFFEDYGEKI